MPDPSGYPLRCRGTDAAPTAAPAAPACLAAEKGSIVFRNRSWVLAESTHATPAIVAPPLALEPANYISEYKTFKAKGRIPDGKGGPKEPTSTDAIKKPVMTVAYLATNGMLHAFRAGPCPSQTEADRLTVAGQVCKETEAARSTPEARSCGASCPSTSSASSRTSGRRSSASRTPT